MKRIKLVDCPCCGSLHPLEFSGDCRDDANRYGAAEDYAERHNVSVYKIDVLDLEDLTA